MGNLNAGWKVAQLLKAYPATAKTLIGLHTSCVECPMNTFCTLEDVSKHYAIPLTTLLKELESSFSSSERRNA